jgi:hypothetical protein
MVIEYTLLTLVLALVYGLVTKFLPDFPLSQEVFYTFVIYVLAKLGVGVVGAPVRAFLSGKFPRLFAK